MAFSVHCTVLAATAAASRTPAAFFVLCHFYYDKYHDSNKYKRYDYSSQIFSKPREHITTPLCLYLDIALELRRLMILLDKEHIAHKCKNNN